MSVDKEINKNRFTGFADVYNDVRPVLPDYPIEIITKYLGRKPERVVDLGCGTGLSTTAWKGNCETVIGIEPNEDMLNIAKLKTCESVSFIKAFSHNTGLEPGGFDAVVCSQSFHWMEPVSALKEIARLLKKGGVFAAVDCDWPPVTIPEIEKAYGDLFHQVEELTDNNTEIKNSFYKWSKENHLSNIRKSNLFYYSREIVFSVRENCTADRLIGLAVSQGGLQALFQKSPELIQPYFDKFREKTYEKFGDEAFEIDFCYRMRIAVK